MLHTRDAILVIVASGSIQPTIMRLALGRIFVIGATKKPDPVLSVIRVI